MSNYHIKRRCLCAALSVIFFMQSGSAVTLKAPAIVAIATSLCAAVLFISYEIFLHIGVKPEESSEDDKQNSKTGAEKHVHFDSSLIVLRRRQDRSNQVNNGSTEANRQPSNIRSGKLQFDSDYNPHWSLSPDDAHAVDRAVNTYRETLNAAQQDFNRRVSNLDIHTNASPQPSPSEETPHIERFFIAKGARDELRAILNYIPGENIDREAVQGSQEAKNLINNLHFYTIGTTAVLCTGSGTGGMYYNIEQYALGDLSKKSGLLDPSDKETYEKNLEVVQGLMQDINSLDKELQHPYSVAMSEYGRNLLTATLQQRAQTEVKSHMISEYNRIRDELENWKQQRESQIDFAGCPWLEDTLSGERENRLFEFLCQDFNTPEHIVSRYSLLVLQDPPARISE